MVSVPIDVTATILAIGLVTLAGLIARGSTWRRGIALAVAASVTLVPWMAELHWLQAVLAVFSLVSFARVIDLVRMRATYDGWRRVVHALSSFDSRKATRAPSAVPVGPLMKALIYASVSLLGLYVIVRAAPNADERVRFVVRSAGGLVFLYCLSETGYGVAWGLARILGFVFPPLHVTPVLSRSVQEFWGERWNRTVNDWLRINCFLPLARRRKPALGLVAAFTASAGLHAYMTVVPLGLVKAGWMTAYFLLQAAVIGVERLLGTARWSTPMAHLWTVVVMVLPSPLFVEPMLEILGL